MLLVFFHLLLTVGVLWFHRKHDYAQRVFVMIGAWFLISLAFIYVDSIIVNRTPFMTSDILRGTIVSFFQLPPLGFALKWGKAWRKGLIGPILIYLVFALVSLIVVGAILANADVVRGISLMS